MKFQNIKKIYICFGTRKRTRKQAQKDMFFVFSAMRMCKHHLFCTSLHHHILYEKQQDLNEGLSLDMSVLARARAQLLNTLYINTQGENIYKTVLYIQKLVLSTRRAEWMSGICLIWSRGRLISPSLPIGDDRCLNLSSQKRPPGRNLGEHHLVRRSGTTSRGTVSWCFVCACANTL